MSVLDRPYPMLSSLALVVNFDLYAKVFEVRFFGSLSIPSAQASLHLLRLLNRFLLPSPLLGVHFYLIWISISLFARARHIYRIYPSRTSITTRSRPHAHEPTPASTLLIRAIRLSSPPLVFVRFPVVHILLSCFYPSSNPASSPLSTVSIFCASLFSAFFCFYYLFSLP